MTKFKSKKGKLPHEDESMIEDAVNSSSQNINEEVNSDEIKADETKSTDANILITELEDKLNKKEKECEEYLDLLKRSKAEFDNYRKRTIKEKENIYIDGFSEGVKQILPVIDNLERAITYTNTDSDSLLKGVEMVLKLFNDTLAKAEVEELPSVGSKFDPDYHDAVMHIVDENLEENVVVEVLQKGYKYKDKIVRHSMVKVAN